ncbi:WhiB family transcriptional regulator [Streptomyces sp. NPDC004288]
MNPSSTRAISTDSTPDWRTQADCRRTGRNPDWWFPTGTKTRKDREQAADAKAICRECPVAMHCATWALRRREEDGIAGGLDADQRRSIRRRVLKEHLSVQQTRDVIRAAWAKDAQGPLVDTYLRSTRQGNDGHVWWRGLKNTYTVAGRVFTPAQLAFEVGHGRAPQGQVKSICGEQFCVAYEHLTDGVVRWQREHLAAAS